LTSLSFKQNAAAVFAIILTLWAFYSFFSWHIDTIHEKLPEKIISQLSGKGEPLFLSSQLLDKLVLIHPELNIFPAGGHSLKNAGSMENFYIVQKFQPLDCVSIDRGLKSETVVEAEGFVLKRCFSPNRMKTLYASSFLPEMIVKTDNSKIPAEFINGRFKTGPSGWQKIETGSAEFGDEYKYAISAHPLSDKKKITILIPSVNFRTEKIILGAGIANSGSFKGSKHVIITASQKELKEEIITVDGKWIEKELEGFLENEPVEITIQTEKSGKRHFYFDLKYIEAAK